MEWELRGLIKKGSGRSNKEGAAGVNREGCSGVNSLGNTRDK